MLASDPAPATIDHAFWPWRTRASGSRSAGRRLYIPPWLSLTRTSVAPPASAPAIAAFASPTMSSTLAGYPASSRRVGPGWETPAMPSMSTDIQTFTQPTIAGPTTMPDPSPRRFGGERSARLALVGRQDAVGDGRRGEPVRHPELAQDVRD